jgi:hypothetical protein
MKMLSSLISTVRTINRRYAKPQIEMNRLTKICLFGLRVYLFTLVGLMVYKFIETVR